MQKNKAEAHAYRVVVDEDGRPKGFYETTVHGSRIPEEARPISLAQYREFQAHRGERALDMAGGPKLLKVSRIEGKQITPDELLDARLGDPVLGALVDIVAESIGSTREGIRVLLLEKIQTKEGQ